MHVIWPQLFLSSCCCCSPQNKTLSKTLNQSLPQKKTSMTSSKYLFKQKLFGSNFVKSGHAGSLKENYSRHPGTDVCQSVIIVVKSF